jgi:transcription antitermination factor NusG
MPILPPEPDIFPENLFEQDVAATEQTAQWWALYTLARREKDLMRRLRAMRISHYGPLVKRRTRSSNGRVRTAHVPLFASYVFVCGDEQQRYDALTTNCVSRCLAVSDATRLVWDLRQIKRLVDADAPLTPESRLEAGMQVRIRSGPLTGLEGMVVKRHGANCLLVAVEFLQQGASVQLEDCQLEQIGS